MTLTYIAALNSDQPIKRHALILKKHNFTATLSASFKFKYHLNVHYLKFKTFRFARTRVAQLAYHVHCHPLQPDTEWRFWALRHCSLSPECNWYITGEF